MSNEATSTDDNSQDQRLDRLEREMIHEDSLEMAAFRRLLHGLSDENIDSDPIARVGAIVERIDQLETETQRLRPEMGARRRLHLFRERPERVSVLNYVLENLDGLVGPLSLAWSQPIRSLTPENGEEGLSVVWIDRRLHITSAWW